MTKPFRPMLAVAVDDSNVSKINYPVMVSPKLDGIRCTVRDGACWSRSNKLIPNRYVQERFSHLEGFDGELIVGPHDEGVFRRTTSAVMSVDGTPPVQFWAFDLVDHGGRFTHRYVDLQARVLDADDVDVIYVAQTSCDDLWEINIEEHLAIAGGYEGVILRNPTALYKNGRGTMTDQCLMKVKRFVDTELPITGTYEEMANNNEAILDERGYTKRSSHKDGKVGKGVLGGVIVSWNGNPLKIGSGYTAAERAEFWANRDGLVGQIVKFKYFPVGDYDLPRHPVYLGLRHKDDL
jgi:DNA ligase-1